MRQIYYVDLYGSFLLVEASSLANAEKWATSYFGRLVKFVDIATQESIDALNKAGDEIYATD